MWGSRTARASAHETFGQRHYRAYALRRALPWLLLATAAVLFWGADRVAFALAGTIGFILEDEDRGAVATLLLALALFLRGWVWRKRDM